MKSNKYYSNLMYKQTRNDYLKSNEKKILIEDYRNKEDLQLKLQIAIVDHQQELDRSN